MIAGQQKRGEGRQLCFGMVQNNLAKCECAFKACSVDWLPSDKKIEKNKQKYVK